MTFCKTLYPLLSTVSNPGKHPDMTEKYRQGHKASTHAKKSKIVAWVKVQNFQNPEL